MRILFEAALFASVMSFIFTGNVFGDWPEDDEEETEIARDNSWVLGTPDNIPKTEVIIPSDCGCPND